MIGEQTAVLLEMYSTEVQLKKKLVREVCFLDTVGRVEAFKAMCTVEPNIDRRKRYQILGGMKHEISSSSKTKNESFEWYESVK